MIYIDSLSNIWNFTLISKIKITQEPQDFEIIAVGLGLDDSNNCIEIFPTKKLALDFINWLTSCWKDNLSKISYIEYCKDSDYKRTVDELLYNSSLYNGKSIPLKGCD